MRDPVHEDDPKPDAGAIALWTLISGAAVVAGLIGGWIAFYAYPIEECAKQIEICALEID